MRIPDTFASGFGICLKFTVSRILLRRFTLQFLFLAHPFFKISDVKSRPPISAVPKSRETSSVGGKECVDMNEISLPTVNARK